MLSSATEGLQQRGATWASNSASVTALMLATAGATNACLYPAAGLVRADGVDGQFPPVLGRWFRDRAAAGLLVTALAAAILSVGFDLTSIASLGSAVALIVFTLVTAGHLRVHKENGARVWILVVAIASTVIVLATFAATTLVDEPGTAVALVAILLLSVLLDLGWKRSRDARTAGG